MMEKQVTVGSKKQFPPWMRGFLLLAGMYNIIWGVFIFMAPQSYYLWLTGETRVDDLYATVHAIGVLLFGIMYITAAISPTRLWYLPWIGAASKLVGGLLVFIFLLDASLYLPDGTVNRHFLFHLIMNDLVWVPPLFVIALTARRRYLLKVRNT